VQGKLCEKLFKLRMKPVAALARDCMKLEEAHVVLLIVY
jgi:hypothetical protein